MSKLRVQVGRVTVATQQSLNLGKRYRYTGEQVAGLGVYEYLHPQLGWRRVRNWLKVQELEKERTGRVVPIFGWEGEI